MVYSIEIKGTKYNMEQYTPKLAAAFDEFYKKYKTADTFNERLENCIYALVLSLTSNVVKNIFGDLNTVDVNELFVTLERVRDVYMKPLAQYKSKSLIDTISNAAKALKVEGVPSNTENSNTDNKLTPAVE